jgi:hypothetical protein
MTNLLNGPVELALRILILVNEQADQVWTVDNLLVLDHMAVHSADFEGPPSLHPPFPLRSADIGARRTAVRQAIELLIHRGLFMTELSGGGITFRAGDEVHSLAGLLGSPYAEELRLRAQWISSLSGFGGATPVQSRLRQIVESWSEDAERQ